MQLTAAGAASDGAAPGLTGGKRPQRIGGRRIKPRQAALLLLAVLALGIAPPLFASQVPGLRDLDALVHDLYRTALAPRVAMDPDIAIIHYDDVTARETGKTSPIDRTLMARAIRAADQGGAKAIGIDFFFAQPTDDEDALIDAINAATTPITMIYADPEADGGGFWSAEIARESESYQDAFWQRIASADVTRASPMIGTDSANVARSWPERRKGAQPTLSGAMAAIPPGYEGSIAFSRLAQQREGMNDSLSAGMFPTFTLTAFSDPGASEALAPLFAGRYVMIGLDIFNADRFATPVSRILGEEEMPGVAVHAHMLRQALDGNFPAPIPWWGSVLLGIAFASAGAAAGLMDRKRLAFAGATVLLVAAWLAMPALLHAVSIDLLGLPMAGWLVALAAALALGSYLAGARTSRERAFAQGALGKYLAADVVREILEDPDKLSLEGEERALFMMFTDLEGFTRISHSQQPRDTARILNHYLDEMSEVILAHGGTIDKFVGDAIVAFWGAPLAKEDDGPNAVRCALALHECAERLRRELAERGEQLGRTRIGLHHGPVVVGNFGGRHRIQYTALGDAMNTAARLEGANKYLGSDILVSEAVQSHAPDIVCRPLGAIVLSGVDDAICVFEPVADGRAAYAAQLGDAMKGLRTGDTDAVVHLRRLHEQFAEDRALARLVERVDAIKGGKAYVLGSK